MTVPTDVHQTVTGLEPAVPVEFDTTTDLQPPQAAATDTTGDAMDERMEPANEVEATDGTHHAEVAEDPALLVRRFSWTRILAYGVLPGLALVLALGAGYLKWQDGSAPLSQSAAVNPVQAATESTIALLSYRPDTADRDLHAAGDRLTGTFRGDYTKLINDVVIPGAKQKKISAVATVPGAAPMSATRDHAVVLVLVNQTIIIGDGPPTSTASSVRVTLDKVHDKWLISQFDPV